MSTPSNAPPICRNSYIPTPKPTLYNNPKPTSCLHTHQKGTPKLGIAAFESMLTAGALPEPLLALVSYPLVWSPPQTPKDLKSRTLISALYCSYGRFWKLNVEKCGLFLHMSKGFGWGLVHVTMLLDLVIRDECYVKWLPIVRTMAQMCMLETSLSENRVQGVRLIGFSCLGISNGLPPR